MAARSYGYRGIIKSKKIGQKVFLIQDVSKAAEKDLLAYAIWISAGEGEPSDRYFVLSISLFDGDKSTTFIEDNHYTSTRLEALIIFNKLIQKHERRNKRARAGSNRQARKRKA